MTPDQLITQARNATWMDTINYPDTQGIIDFNFVYQDIIADIITGIDEDYFFNIAKGDTVANQEEYNITEIWTSPDNVRINEINKVFIKYADSDTYYTEATRVNPTTLTNDTDWYKVNQPKTAPIFYIQDNSIFVYPAPNVIVTEWLKIHVIYQPQDLTISSTEANILIPPRFHRTIVSWIIPFIYAYKSDNNGFITYSQIFDKEKKDMIAQMKNRNQSVIQIKAPNLNQYT